MILGYTSGRFVGEETFIKRLRFFKKIGCRALEIHLHTSELEIFDSLEAVAKETARFSYVSIHTPIDPNWLVDTPPARDVRAKIDELRQRVNARVMVIHPNIIAEPEILRRLNWPLAIENMDWRKQDGRWVKQLERWFKIFPQAMMVLDLNHVYTNDRSMGLGRQLWQSFKDKIKHIHLSGFRGEGAIHEPFIKSDCGIILESVPTTALPLVLEVNTADLGQADLIKELEFVRDKLFV